MQHLRLLYRITIYNNNVKILTIIKEHKTRDLVFSYIIIIQSLTKCCFIHPKEQAITDLVNIIEIPVTELSITHVYAGFMILF